MKEQIVQLFHNIIGKKADAGSGTGTKKAKRLSEHVPPHEQNAKAFTAYMHDMADDQTGQYKDWRPARTEGEDPADRRTFLKFVDEALTGKETDGCLLIADLDRFKEVNRMYGDAVGDRVLRSVADTFRDVFGERVCLGRLSGDIFALWAPEVSRDCAEEIRSRVGAVNDRLLHPAAEIPPVSLSAGVAFFQEGDDSRSLGRRANESLYRVKESGRCGCEIYGR